MEFCISVHSRIGIYTNNGQFVTNDSLSSSSNAYGGGGGGGGCCEGDKGSTSKLAMIASRKSNCEASERFSICEGSCGGIEVFVFQWIHRWTHCKMATGTRRHHRNNSTPTNYTSVVAT